MNHERLVLSHAEALTGGGPEPRLERGDKLMPADGSTDTGERGRDSSSGLESYGGVQTPEQAKVLAEKLNTQAKKGLDADPNYNPFHEKDESEIITEYYQLMRVGNKFKTADFGLYRGLLIKAIRTKFSPDEANNLFIEVADFIDNLEGVKSEKEKPAVAEATRHYGGSVAQMARAEWELQKLASLQNRLKRELTSDEVKEHVRLTPEEEEQARLGIPPEISYLHEETAGRVHAELKDRIDKSKQKKGVTDTQLENMREDIKKIETVADLKAELADKKGKKFGAKLRNMLVFQTGEKRGVIDQQIQDVINAGTTRESLLSGIEGLLEDIRAGHEERINSWNRVPASIQEVSKMIMEREEDFSEIGPHALLDIETGEFRQDNFMRWIRNGAMYWHGFTPDDKIDLFSMIQIYTGQRAYSFSEMMKNDNYFTDADTHKVDRTFRDQVLHEVWLFSTSHNNDAVYRANMGTDDLPKVLQQFYFQNNFTKLSSGKSTFEWILTMPGWEKKTVPVAGGGAKEMRVENTKNGQALRRALLTYYYLNDYDMLKKVYGDNGGENEDVALFRERHLLYSGGKLVKRALNQVYKVDNTDTEGKYLDKQGNPKKMIFEQQADGSFKNTGKDAPTTPEDDPEWAEWKEWERPSEVRKTIKNEETGESEDVWVWMVPGKGGREGTGMDDNVWNHEWFKNGEKGGIKDGSKQDFIGYINIWNDVQRDLDSKTVVREKIRQSIMEKEGISYEDAEYVENWAFTMGRWTGIGAKNDDGAVGFDGWTKVQNFLDYRMRQGQSRRGGQAGNIYNTTTIKRIGVDFFLGAMTTEGETLLGRIQGGYGTDVNIDPAKITGITFRDNTSAKFIEDHVSKCFSILQKLMEGGEFNFDQAGIWDEFSQTFAIDQKKLNEILEGLQKDLRNAYSTFKQLDFSKQVRYLEKTYSDDEKAGHAADKVTQNHYKTTSIAEMMFGDMVLEGVKKKYLTEDIPRRQAEIGKALIKAKKDDPSFTKEQERELKAELEKKFEEWKQGNLNQDPDSLGYKEPDLGKLYNQDREYNWREVMKGFIVAEMIGRHKFGSPYKQSTIDQVEQYWEALRKVPGGIHLDFKNPRNIEVIKQFFTDEEIEEMRKKSGTTFWRWFIAELLLATAGGAIAGSFTGAKGVAKEAVSMK